MGSSQARAFAADEEEEAVRGSRPDRGSPPGHHARAVSTQGPIIVNPAHCSAVAAEHGLGPLGPGRTPTPDDRDELLTRTLTLVGSRWTPAEVRWSMATANTPSQVIEAIVNSLPIPPPIASLERLLPVLIDLWNDTRATPATATPRKKTKVGANQPCPCGSGKKYKRCCMLHETTH